MYRLILLALFASATAVWAQDSAPEDEPVSEPVIEPVSEPEAKEPEGLSAEELDDLDLDRQEDHTEEDDDVFKPTDVVSYQQSVNFPVDI
jgi:hypothetical protein